MERLMRVEVKNNDVGAALRKLKKLVFKENILKDYMEHTFYEKPSVKKRRKRKEALQNARRAQRDNADF